MIADMPVSERPRERLVARGSDALSDAELLAIILGKGTRGKSILELTNELLAHFGSLQALTDASIEELVEIKGIGNAKAIQLKAIFGLAKRSIRPEFVWRYPIYAPEDVYRYIHSAFHACDTERLLLIMRDSKGRAYKNEVLAIGSANYVALHPRDLMRRIVKEKAHSFILCHNHPSGDSTPSKLDYTFTEKVARAAEAIGVPLDDHLVIGGSEFSSLYRLCVLPSRSGY